jgi:hypothetical protein
VIVGLAVVLNFSPPFALVFLLGLLGAAAYGFGARGAAQAWKWLAYLWWIGAAALFMLYLIVEGVVSPAFGIVLLFVGEAIMLMAFAVRRPAATPPQLADAVVEWRSLDAGIEAEQPVTSDR